MKFDEIARQDASEVRTADALCDLADALEGPSHSRCDRVSKGGSTFYRRRGKRAMDLILVIISAPAWVPLIALLALLVRRDGGPAFYTQDRIGMGGRVFRMWKLRSMVVGADELLEGYLASNAEARDEWDRKQKLLRDPRITNLGAFIRKTSLDELPQLWNVLVGEMSLVGPRPMLVQQATRYSGRAYFLTRPGLTGPWQVSHRNDVPFADRITFDEEYEAKIGLWTDFILIMRTIYVVLRASGV